jgi:hypothetical protein
MSSPINAFACVNSIIQNNTRYSFSLSNLCKVITITALPIIVLLANQICMPTCEASSIFVRGSNYTCEDFCRGDCTEFTRTVVGSQAENFSSNVFFACLHICLRERC